MEGKRASGLGVAFGSLLCLGLASALLNPPKPPERKEVSVPETFHLVSARGRVDEVAFSEYLREFSEAARSAPNDAVNMNTVDRISAILVRAQSGHRYLHGLGDGLRMAGASKDLQEAMDLAALQAIRNRPRYTYGTGRDLPDDPIWKSTFLKYLKEFVTRYPSSNKWRGFLVDFRRMENDPKKRFEILKGLDDAVGSEKAKATIRGQMWMARQAFNPVNMVISAKDGTFDLNEHKGRYVVVAMIPPKAPRFNTDFEELGPLSQIVHGRACDYAEISRDPWADLAPGQRFEISDDESLEEYGVTDGGMVLVFDQKGKLIQTGRVSTGVTSWLNGDLDRLGVPQIRI